MISVFARRCRRRRRRLGSSGRWLRRRSFGRWPSRSGRWPSRSRRRPSRFGRRPSRSGRWTGPDRCGGAGGRRCRRRRCRLFGRRLFGRRPSHVRPSGGFGRRSRRFGRRPRRPRRFGGRRRRTCRPSRRRLLGRRPSRVRRSRTFGGGRRRSLVTDRRAADDQPPLVERTHVQIVAVPEVFRHRAGAIVRVHAHVLGLRPVPPPATVACEHIICRALAHWRARK